MASGTCLVSWCIGACWYFRPVRSLGASCPISAAEPPVSQSRSLCCQSQLSPSRDEQGWLLEVDDDPHSEPSKQRCRWSAWRRSGRYMECRTGSSAHNAITRIVPYMLGKVCVLPLHCCWPNNPKETGSQGDRVLALEMSSALVAGGRFPSRASVPRPSHDRLRSDLQTDPVRGEQPPDTLLDWRLKPPAPDSASPPSPPAAGFDRRFLIDWPPTSANFHCQESWPPLRHPSLPGRPWNCV